MKKTKRSGGRLVGRWVLAERMFSTGEGWQKAADNFIRLLECEFREDGTAIERFADGDGYRWEFRTDYFCTDNDFLCIDRSLYGLNDLHIMRSQLMQIVRATDEELWLDTTGEQSGIKTVRLLRLKFRKASPQVN